ncbi:KdsC family phosphatase [Tautonia plasticadhaerens]|uniref:3-deoxy-D-manno-octulosonate 8-phosphate phosphatase KdsC n=1 Tax=Tautonia plasticadhaerens TaxID=2527974 RepID=A0A518GYC6_9BACT|nr:HAD family hydrolase [Tautonia plasticadhaerens]QDV33563.1 3-deoxy-D-manno-octulosonate 8-phosphate phosphatase KdsC [Tautonia plasticadhaerens]
MPQPIEVPEELAARCRPIALLVLDVDGVMTDGIIALDDHGIETKRFFVRDGSALALWRMAGHRGSILSGRWAPAVERRAAELGLSPVIQGAKDKGARLVELLARLGLGPHQACMMGDDLPDLPALRVAGLAACPADAVPEVRSRCHLVSNRPGGRGAVRGVVEAILRAQGRWDDLVRSYLEPEGEPARDDPGPSG